MMRAFAQSLVLHSLQHMTSVFIHTSPMLLTLGLRFVCVFVDVFLGGVALMMMMMMII